MIEERTAVQGFEWARWIAEYGSDPPSVLGAAKAARQRGSITREELLRIVYWKSPRAAGKVANGLSTCGSDTVCDLPTSDSEAGDEVLIGNLMRLRGVSVSVASAVLALVYPERFAVTDWRARDELKKLSRKYAAEDTMGDYLKQYLPRIREIAGMQGITPRRVEMALWAHSRETSVRKLLDRACGQANGAGGSPARV